MLRETSCVGNFEPNRAAGREQISQAADRPADVAEMLENARQHHELESFAAECDV